MKHIATLALVAGLSGVAFSMIHRNTPPHLGDPNAPTQMTLQQGVDTVLYAGIQQDGDQPPGSNDDAGGSATNYCQAANNSTGFPALISYGGSLSLTDNTFALNVAGVPPKPNSWGMFTYGQVQYNVPFGNGYLCISPFAPGIFKMPTQSLAAGTVSLSMASHPIQFLAFTPGSSWNYQFWYRDPDAGGANFNLSDGLHVVFAP
jgi:hypothetical protein